MAAFSSRVLPPLAAVAVATLLLSSWSGAKSANPGAAGSEPVIPPIQGETSTPYQGQGGTPRRLPDDSLPIETKQEIQRALQQRGYYAGTIDGRFGQQTRQAIRDYQSSIGARQTGSLSDQERNELLRPPPPVVISEQPPGGCAGPRL